MRMCFDKRVLIGLAVLAVALLAINPSLFGAALPILVLLACPLSMVVMMWAMSGQRRSSCGTDERAEDDVPAEQRVGASSDEGEVAELRGEVARLRAELELRRPSEAGASAPLAARRSETHTQG